MGRKRIVLLAGRSFTGTYIASRVLSSGKDVAAIVVETGKPGVSRKRDGEGPARKVLWYLKTGQMLELADRCVSFFWKFPYEWTHTVNRWKEVCAARVNALFSPKRPYAERRKEETYFFFEDLGKLYRVPIMTVTNLNHPDSVEAIRHFSPDLLVICGTRKLHSEVLHLAPSGALNIHGSLLPKYRGLMAEFWALYHGSEEAVGATIHYADGGLDTGDIILQRKVDVTSQDTFRSLRFKTTRMGGALMVEALELIEKGEVQRIPQGEKETPSFHQPTFSQRQTFHRMLRERRKQRWRVSYGEAMRVQERKDA